MQINVRNNVSSNVCDMLIAITILEYGWFSKFAREFSESEVFSNSFMNAYPNKRSHKSESLNHIRN